jgi:hypothetical protein
MPKMGPWYGPVKVKLAEAGKVRPEAANGRFNGWGKKVV